MFSLKRLEDLADGVAEPLSLLNTRVLEALGRRIALARSGRFDRLSTLTSAEKEANALYTSILRELGKTSASADEVFAEAAKIAYENANRFYAARGIKQLPIKYQTGLINFVLGVAQTTKQTFTNLSNSSAIGFRVLNADGSVRYTGFKEQYLRLVDQAIAEVATGQKDYGSALRHAMKQTADSGIRLVDYQSGYSRRLDSAMRQSVLDGVKDIAHEVSRRTGEEFGANGVEISAHNYCAMDHLPFQGKQFSHKQFDDVQNSLPRQFGQYNCRHTLYPVILGISTPSSTDEDLQEMAATSTEKRVFEGREYTGYEATQLQRRLETAIRASKDRAVMAKAAGDDLTRRVEQARINQLKDKYIDLSKKFGLPYASERMSVSGFRAVKSTDKILSEIVEKGYNPRNIMFDNKKVRKKYIESVSNIPNLLDKTKDLQEQAIQAFDLRNTYRTNARNAMKDQETRSLLDKARPNPTFEEMLRHKMLDKGLSHEDALRDIILSATTTNKRVDDLFAKD